MYELNLSELCALHQQNMIRQAAAARLLHHCHPPKLSLAIRARLNLGDLLIRIGQRLKEAPRRLEAEPASLSSLTIIL